MVYLFQKRSTCLLLLSPLLSAHEKIYQMLRKAMNYAVAAPNYGLSGKHDEMDRILAEKLSLPPI